MRYLGIDYGAKKIGLAISDETGSLAFPKDIIQNDHNIFSKLEDLIKEENIKEIVLGKSEDFKGRPNSIGVNIGIFQKELTAKFGLPVHMQKEFFTSVEARKGVNTKNNKTGAHSRMKKVESKNVDDQAAALILQRYLDKYDKHR